MLASNLDGQGILEHHRSRSQRQASAHAAPAAAALEDSLADLEHRLEVLHRNALPCGVVCLGAVGDKTQSRPFNRSAFASLPPPVEIRWGSNPAPRKPASASASAAEEFGTR